jgi:hypothetical protein
MPATPAAAAAPPLPPAPASARPTPHRKSSAPRPAVRPESVIDWSVDDVAGWMHELSFLFDPILPRVRELGIDGARAMTLTPEQLNELGVRDASLIKYYTAVTRRLMGRSSSATLVAPLHAQPPVAPPPPPPQAAVARTASGSSLPASASATTSGAPAAAAAKAHAANTSRSGSDELLPRISSFVSEGAFFLKHGRDGKPKPKFVCVSPTTLSVIWAPTVEEAYKLREGCATIAS